MELNVKGGSVSLRPKPLGYKPSGRAFNELEQTPDGLLYSHTGSRNFRSAYRFAANVFDAQAHHMVDLAYIDQMLYKAGFTSGARGTLDYSEARQRVIQGLRDNGVDVGNVRGNIAPLSQQMGPRSNKTGMAHKWVHDAYKNIPEAPDEVLRSMDEKKFINYLTEKSRQRKDYVGQAMEHKHNALMKAHPELQGQSPEAIRDWIKNNKSEFGSLGDDTFNLQRRNPASVPNQPRGRVNIKPEVNRIYRNSPNNFMGSIIPEYGAAIDELSGGKIDKGIQKVVNKVRTSVGLKPNPVVPQNNPKKSMDSLKQVHENAKAARKRGGRIKLFGGAVSLPDVGLSEYLGFN